AMALFAVAAAAQAPRPRPQPTLTIDQLVQIKHPSGHQWTPDGAHVWFIYDSAGVNNVWVAPADGSSPARPLTTYADGQTGNGGIWSKDGRTFFFQRDGGLLAVPVSGGAPRTAWASAAHARGFSLSPDGTRIAFVTGGANGGDLIVHTIATSSDQTLAHADSTLGAPSWSADGANLVYSVGGRAAEPIQHHASPPEVGPKLIFVATEFGRGGGGGTTFTIPASGGTPQRVAGRGAGAFGGFGRGGSAWIDATHTLSTRMSNGGTIRTTESVDANGGAPVILHVDTAAKFFSSVNTTNNAISPDHRWLLYTSDVTGWDQIYVVPTAGGRPVQITKTPGEHWRAGWSHDSRRIAWDANTADKPGTRQIQFATIGDNPAVETIVTVTSGTGTNTAPQWSPDDRRLLFQHTDARSSADLYVADAVANARVTRLTSSLPTSIDKSQLIAPTLIHYPGPDGKSVPAWLFVPKNVDRTKKHAAIVWIHPDGVNQSYDGWHPDRNEAVYYEFHQYLLQQGYVVIAPDYRGSIGYGREWRNDVYMDVGGNDAKDARMAATYLKSLGYVDPDRIGVWGLSYGGFFTLLAITQEPTWFRAAVDVAGVADYELYYDDPYHGGWTTSRIGTPEEHPEVYAKAAPMSHVDQLQHPLLILHGTADVNVPFIHSVLLVDHLMKAGKGDLTTFMVYPGEYHYFDRGFVVRDAWQRVDAFFRKNLQPDVTR
ncbi:MAG TPA: LpqB family beta-propeller domain-containing protein, partial [Gemmatimonadaceae bacterium]|nr:LpqB family beta-propeller domain-containing protein [Gemmatimonadaceae bacterium]